MQPIEKIHRPLKKMLWNNFLGGIAWGLGVTIGLSLVLAFLTFVVQQIDLVPVVGNFISDVLNYMIQNNDTLKPQ